MFLKSLTMRGFKSFADKTMLEVEPGITVIVGPNGSGKSNVVDALAWVLGTHSPSKVRGGTMSDVIFAGSPTRNALGHARVEIVIDNSQGQLGSAGMGTSASAQQFTEVRVAREIHSNGDTSYQINGEEVRALDVQELLSDTGLGRELHTIVGQGQLDEILNARPEERRKFIEEAAGILKHRRRRERALRKLDQVEVHIEKLRALLRELRRQLRPLERQAEAANRYTTLQAQLRDVQIRIGAAALAGLDRRMADGASAEQSASERLGAAETEVAERRAATAALEAELAEHGPAAEAAQATSFRLGSLLERLRGTTDLIDARRRHLIEYVEEPLAGRPPEDLRDHAGRIDTEHAERTAERDLARTRLDEATTSRREAEGARRDHEARVQAEARRRAELRERVLRWEGEVSALRGAIAAAESESGRVAAQLEGLDARVVDAEQEVTTVHDEIKRLDIDEVDLTSEVEAAEHQVAAADAEVERLVAGERDCERERSSQAARAEALQAALAERDDGTSALTDAELDGVLGLVATHVRITGDAEAAVAAALGPLGGAVVAASTDRARDAIVWLRKQSVGRAIVLAQRDADAAGPTLSADVRHELASAGVQPIIDFLIPRDGVVAERTVGALRGALAGTFVVADWDAAVARHEAHPELTFVSRDGDVAGPRGYAGGQAPERSAVVTATAADEASARAVELAAQLEKIRAELEVARATRERGRVRLAEATEQINESDARITGAAERLARLNKEVHSLRTQHEVVAAQERELHQLVARDRGALSELNSRGPEVEADVDAEPGPDDEAQRLDERVEVAREAELDARVGSERIEEQLRHLASSAQNLRREADEVELALAQAARRRELRRQGIVRCGELATFAASATESLERSIAAAQVERDRLQDLIRDTRERLTASRERLEQATAVLTEVREDRHAADLRRSEVEHELAALTQRLRSDLAMSPDEVRAEHADAADFDRAKLQEQEDVLVRKLGLLGRVNPLALEEFKALEDRHAFLSDQIEDLRGSKRDLEEVVVAVDDKIRKVFAAAFEDVAREFEQIFQTVFPGGHGRLVLTDPDDHLLTGIEVEARPPGKKVKRLSLLSGGERSLTVLAFVFAIFRARPSPFYVLDEVDAALDDVNLQRLLRVVSSFKGHSQLIVVTHQKRSMEIADVMYGVTMGPDAVTKVVAERLTEADPMDEDDATKRVTVAEVDDHEMSTEVDADAEVDREADADVEVDREPEPAVTVR